MNPECSAGGVQSCTHFSCAGAGDPSGVVPTSGVKTRGLRSFDRLRLPAAGRVGRQKTCSQDDTHRRVPGGGDNTQWVRCGVLPCAWAEGWTRGARGAGKDARRRRRPLQKLLTCKIQLLYQREPFLCSSASSRTISMVRERRNSPTAVKIALARAIGAV
jgi:hypothetical protein